MKAVSHTLKGSVGISLKGGGWYDGLHFRCDLSPDPVQDSAGNKITVLKNMLGWLANSESSFLMKRKH